MVTTTDSQVTWVHFISACGSLIVTRSFFFLSGVMKPFLAFLAAADSSSRLRTSAFLRSISACLAARACQVSVHGYVGRLRRKITTGIHLRQRRPSSAQSPGTNAANKRTRRGGDGGRQRNHNRVLSRWLLEKTLVFGF